MKASNVQHAGMSGTMSGGVTAINSTAMMEREHAGLMDIMGHDNFALDVAKLMGGAQNVDVSAGLG